MPVWRPGSETEVPVGDWGGYNLIRGMLAPLPGFASNKQVSRGERQMGLTFAVGNPTDVFIEPFGERVRSTFVSQFGTSVVLNSAEAPYYSEELGWSGWRLLQERAVEVVTANRLLHFLSMEAWCGCYVPTATEPGSFEFDGEPTPLAVASLPALVSELEAVGTALRLPTDEAGLRGLTERYQDDEAVDDDMDIQTYAQLLLAARIALLRRQVLWIIK